jgi:hypothetical protein
MPAPGPNATLDVRVSVGRRWPWSWGPEWRLRPAAVESSAGLQAKRDRFSTPKLWRSGP